MSNKTSIIGSVYRIPNGIEFKVIVVNRHSPEEKNSIYSLVCMTRTGYLAVAKNKDELIPCITLERGVARLVAIEIDGAIHDSPSNICKALRINSIYDRFPVVKNVPVKKGKNVKR